MILGFQLILQMCVSVIPIYLTTVLWFKWFTVTTPRIFFDSEMLSIEIYIFFYFSIQSPSSQPIIFGTLSSDKGCWMEYLLSEKNNVFLLKVNETIITNA